MSRPRAATGGVDGVIAFGPYVRLPVDSYRALFTIVAENCAQAAGATA